MNRFTGCNSRAVSVIAVLLTALAMLTLTLAMLTENLKVNTLISTGELDISYDDIEVFESGEAEAKDVGECKYTLETVNGVEVLTILIKNGYPGYECTIRFNITNTGTIPVVGPFFNMTNVPEGVQVYFSPAELAQLHPGDKASYSVFARVLQNARESFDYAVIIEITYIQWNEHVLSSSISGYIWEDLDGNGIWNTNIEPPLANIEVYLVQNNVVVNSAITDNSGYYVFTIMPGTYVITPKLLPGYMFTTPQTITITTYSGRDYPNNNFGMYKLQVRPIWELTVNTDFRETNTNFNRCPAGLGTLLQKTSNGSYVVYATIPKAGRQAGKVNNVNPGAFYFVMNISGVGITRLNITIKYDNQFNIEDGVDGRVQVYVLNTTTGCTTNITSIGTLAYNVDNDNNHATINVTLNNALSVDTIILVYVKYKEDITGRPWNTLDKHFEVQYAIDTNTGSAWGHAIVQIVEK